jgi:hypothetical protein
MALLVGATSAMGFMEPARLFAAKAALFSFKQFKNDYDYD